MQKPKIIFFVLLARYLFIVAAGALPALGGTVITDGSVGHARVLTGPNFTLTPDLGLIRGGNLFQSLKTLDLSPGDAATFRGPATVRSVLARITGASPTHINGSLRCTIPHADFYLINPAGVIFGPQASLDISGSFTVATADSVKLSDGTIFGIPSNSDVQLTTGAPRAFGFLKKRPAAIAVDGSRLRVPSRHNISMAAGTVTINAGTLIAPAGTIGVLSLGSPGTASFATAGASAVPPLRRLANMSLTAGSQLVTTGVGGGRIAVTANNLTLTDSGLDATTEGGVNGRGISLQLAGQLSDSGSFIFSNTSGSGSGGSIQVRAMRIVADRGTVSTPTGILTHVNPGATGAGGNITLRAAHLAMTQGQYVSSTSFSSGHGGNVDVVAGRVTLESIGLPQSTATGIFAQSDGSGDGGSIRIHAGILAVKAGSVISGTCFQSGLAGPISIVARQLTLDGRGNRYAFTGIDSSSNPGSRSAAGSVVVHVTSARIVAGGAISSSTISEGRAGDVVVVADQLKIDGRGSSVLPGGSRFTGLSSSAFPGSTSAAGSIRVQARVLNVLNAADIISATFSEAKGGDVSITASTLEVAGTDSTGNAAAITADTGEGSTGPAGKVAISAHAIRVASGGAISSRTVGPGRGGDVSLRAETLTLDGSHTPSKTFTGISASSENHARGDAGRIIVKATGDLQILGRAGISTTARHAGGGDEKITAGRLDLRNGFITTAAAGAGGDITLDAGSSLLLSPKGRVSASSGGTARADKGGNIVIKRTVLTFLPGVGKDAISANANQGNGGNITIEPGTFLRPPGTPASAIDSSSAGGLAGTIRVESPEVNLTGELVPLVTSLSAAGVTLVPGCSMRLGADQSSFTLEGGNGLPSEPSQWQASFPPSFDPAFPSSN